MKEHEETTNDEENFNSEQGTLKTTIDYLADLKKKLDVLGEAKSRLINKLKTKIDEKEKDKDN